MYESSDLFRRGERLALSSVIHHITTQKVPNRVWCMKHRFQELVDLVNAASGLALVVMGLGHVVAVDTTTSTRVILDSSPRNPRPLELSIENLVRVGISQVDLAYSLSLSSPMPLNPKKRKNRRLYWDFFLFDLQSQGCRWPSLIIYIYIYLIF